MENLADAVLYCCDAPDETWTPALNAASRMQLLSAPPSLAYATLLAAGERPTRACSSRCGRTCGRTRAGKPC